MNLSIFPNGIDTFVEHYDIQPSDLPNIRRYQELKQKSYLSVEEQNELSNLTHALREKIFLADDFNKLQDCITNLETFFRDETQGHLDGLKEDLKNLSDKTLADIVQAGEDYINTSLHMYTSWVTTAGQSDFNILEGSETIGELIELDFQEDILDLFLNGDMLLPDRDYTFVNASNGKKQVIKLSADIASTVVLGQRLIAKWFINVGKLYIKHSDEHKFGGKDALVVDMNMLSEEVRLAIGDTTQVDSIVKELEKVRQDLTGKANTVHKHTKSDITDFPTSLPANGGNSDTVDGKHASDFASSNHNHNGTYAPVNHAHGDYSPTSHTHNQYAPTSHTHNYAPNNGFASTAEAQTGNDNSKYMTALRVKEAIAKLGMTNVNYVRMMFSGVTISATGNSSHNKMRIMGGGTGDFTKIDDNHFRVNKAGTYAIIYEVAECELISGGSSTYGINLNYNIAGYSSAPYGFFTPTAGKNFTFNMVSCGVMDFTTTENIYAGVGASSQSSSSFSIKAGNAKILLIRLGD